MNTIYPKHRKGSRLIALLLTILLTFPLLSACGSRTAPPPPQVDDTRGGTIYNAQPANQTQVKKGVVLFRKG